MRILLVDDNDINLKVANLMLKNLGYELKQEDIARDGLEALACLRARAYDLVLMDIQMPNMSGLEATAALRRNEGNVFRVNMRTKVVAVSASFVGENLAELGLDGHILKPITKDVLEASIRSSFSKPLSLTHLCITSSPVSSPSSTSR
jgi:CheY-like chemotaxis protein